MDTYLAALDQGTTSTRCIIFEQSGQIISMDQKEHQQFYPKPGWVEHDPQEIWVNSVQVIMGAMLKAGLAASQIAALGITNQRETIVAWNKHTGKTYGNAIVWQDTRSDQICHELSAAEGQFRYQSKTGLPIATYFSGPKIKWLLQNNEQFKDDTNNGIAVIGTIDSWLIWNLTGGSKDGLHFTDATNASRTLLYNIFTSEWDEKICADLGIPIQLLPTVTPSIGRMGLCQSVLPGTPICGVLGDQQAALFGQTCFLPGQAKNTYGTGCFMLMNTGEKAVLSKHGLLTTVGYQLENSPAVYCLEGSIAIAGALVQWLRDNLKLIENSDAVEALAASVPDNGDVYFVPAFSGLFAPYWRSDARGTIIGLSRFSNQGHVARAALEATAFQTRKVLEAMQVDSGIILDSLKVDGGMVKNNLLMQFQADILGKPVLASEISETTALGAAYAAGLGVGIWHDLEQLAGKWKPGSRWSPHLSQTEADHLFQRWEKAVSHSFNWIEQ